jgi:hypothetical protein
VEIVGTRGNDEVRQSASVFVYIPMNVASFTVSPSPLVRHVVTAIDVSWDVPGAVLTRISGLDDFTTSLYESEHTDSATLQGIGGVADTALTLSLYAEDEAGNILEETLVVDVVDASCTADSDVTLHEGPAELYQQVGTVHKGKASSYKHKMPHQAGYRRHLQAVLWHGVSVLRSLAPTTSTPTNYAKPLTCHQHRHPSRRRSRHHHQR